MVKHLLTMWETRVQSLGQEDPLEKEMATHSSTLAWKIPWMEEPGRLHTVHGITKSQTRLSNQNIRASQVVLMVKNLPANAGDMSLTSGSGRSPGGGHGNLLQYSYLENSMDTWTEESGGLQSMQLQRVGNDCVTNTHLFNTFNNFNLLKHVKECIFQIYYF